MASSIALKSAKKELRSLMKKRLASISAEFVDVQSATVFHSVTSLKLYQEATRIGIYLAMPSGELQTDAIVRHALQAGKQVFVPYLHKAENPPPDTPRSVMDMVALQNLSDYSSLGRDSWGIPTIGPDAIEQREHILKDATKESKPLDLILVPGVAFSVDPKTGYVRRLGHGRGFYDYFLHRYLQSRRSHAMESISPRADVLLYGLALEEQFLQDVAEYSVPVGEQDSLLHGLFTGNGNLVEGPWQKS